MAREESTMAEGPLQGKVAIVTGAGSPIGIGHAITLGFVRAGARVAMLDLNQTWLEQSVREAKAIGGEDCALAIVADVTDPDAVEQAVRRTVAAFGGLHILVNNAGTNPRAAGLAPVQQAGLVNFWQISPEAWSRVVAVNLSGPFLMARAVMEHMLAQRWGRIIGVTTSLDTMYRKGGVPYGPSKAGHEALVAAMAQELEGTGVTANVLVPGGATNTNLIAPDPGYDRAALIQPEVMQAPAVWLASDASHACSGRRLIAYHWDERLPLNERLAKASAPAAWPQLGRQAISPQR
jgi:NAD(P)-dependent dehydrogenase (short-subunit alcohol dehydrogenase family)